MAAKITTITAEHAKHAKIFLDNRALGVLRGDPRHPAVGMWKPADTALVAGHRVVIALVRV